MALLTATSVPTTGVAVSFIPVSSSDTIAAADIGERGALFRVTNSSGSSVTVTFVDPGTTAVGNAGVSFAKALAAGEQWWFRLTPSHVNTATNVATVTYSATTSVTCQLIRC